MLNKLVSWMIPAVPRRVVGQVAGRYIAGESRDSALDLVSRLRAQGFVTTLDVLGEDITRLDQAGEAVEEYLALIAALAARFPDERNVSLKLSQFGLAFDQEACFREVARVVERAATEDTFVRLDMEDARFTDATLAIYRRLRDEVWPRVGTVLQARLRRTVEDARRLAGEGASIRLCKGIYREAAAVAFTGFEEVRRAYVEAARALLRGGALVGFATHDQPLIERIRPEIQVAGVGLERVEFQALLGVPIRSVLEGLRDEGFRVRLYVPFGKDWYAYSLRRLKENPEMAGAIALSLLKRDRMDAATTT